MGVNDWRAYDTVAEAYERIAAARFATVARHLLVLARPPEGARVLDLGTGTGAVGVALADGLNGRRLLGCDLSLPMLIRARRQVPGLSPVLANAARLPFRQDTFDLVTANCVLSHLPDYRGTLHEILRVLAKPASFAASCWGPASDPYGEVWSNLLDGAAGDGTVQRATEAVVPWESHFSSTENVRTALREAGFNGVHLDMFDLTSDLSVEEYVSDRALGAGGRLGRRAMGEPRWQEFLQQAEAEFRHRFGDRVHFSRPVVLGVGTVA
jgi:ubiquinone/menaquinone biosynthesis C-methylase UbiE